jgi:predicted RNA-binding Zn-ribbon protein involved in translation (DUF1610 family)
MKCPKCGQEMIIKSQDSSIDDRVKVKKLYFRTVYWCAQEDIWINVEMPKEEVK